MRTHDYRKVLAVKLLRSFKEILEKVFRHIPLVAVWHSYYKTFFIGFVYHRIGHVSVDAACGSDVERPPGSGEYIMFRCAVMIAGDDEYIHFRACFMDCRHCVSKHALHSCRGLGGVIYIAA